MAESSWIVTATASAECGVEVKCYRSQHTGLSIIHADVREISNGIVKGHFLLPTEAQDDDGCPHTLEHLVFMGSEAYPYKGVLDHLANRCLAQGTNAWTDTDHTCYTLTTAGSEGFLSILPVYLDHVLFPTLTDSAFLTEVHHINGEGEDAGVVYSEMQGRENTSSSLSFLSLQRSLYAGTGYAYETGGLMANLRNLQAEKVRNYHQAYYRADNLSLIVSGTVDMAALFKAVQPIEDKLMARNAKLEPMIRPFSKPVPPLEKSVVNTVVFPDDDGEGNGAVYVGWRGPVMSGGEKDLIAIDLLWTYLTETSVAPLQEAFVECDSPYCSDVGYMSFANSTTSHIVDFSDVEGDMLDGVLERLLQCLRDVANEGLDMKRMKELIGQRYHKELEAMEVSPHNTITYSLINYVLHGSSSEDLRNNLVKTALIDAAAQLTNEDWVGLLKRYYLDQPYVCVVAKPSSTLSKTMAKDERKRVEKQRASLGAKRLEELQSALDEAVLTNSKAAPLSVLRECAVPDPSNIAHIPVVSVYPDRNSNTEVARHVHTPQSKKPEVELAFDHVQSRFVELNVHMDTSHLSDEQRLLLELYKDIIFELPVRHNGALIPYEEVVKQLAADVVENSVSVGFGGSESFSCGSMSSLVILGLRVDAEKYAIGVEWVQKLLWQTEFTIERIKVSAKRLLNEISDLKRSGSKVCRLVSSQINFPTGLVNQHQSNLYRQQAFLASVLKMAKKTPKELLQLVETCRMELCQARLLRVQVVGNLLNMANPLEPWSNLVIPSAAVRKPGPVPPVNLMSQLKPKIPPNKAVVVPMSTIESSYLLLTADGPADYHDDDIAPIKVLLEYLTAAEGVFWRAIRGNGLAYGCFMTHSVESGLISFNLYKSNNVVAAYEASREILKRFATGEETFGEEGLEAAKSGQIFSLTENEETMSMAAHQVYKHVYCTLLGPNALQDQIAAVQRVTLLDLQRVFDKYVTSLFSPQRSTVVVTTNVDKAQEAIDGLRKSIPHIERVDNLGKFFA